MAITDARIFHYHVLSQLDKFLECGFVTLGVLPRLHGNQSVVLFFFVCLPPLSTMMDPSGVFNSADYLYIEYVIRQNRAD